MLEKRANQICIGVLGRNHLGNALALGLFCQ
jgi:hypothetical protein